MWSRCADKKKKKTENGRGKWSPVRARGVKSGMCPPYPERDRKRRLNRAVCRNHRIKGGPVSVLGRARLKPYEMSMALGARP